jgi:hypothetical protein
MVFDLRRYRSNSIDSDVESITWINIINRKQSRKVTGFEARNVVVQKD